MATVQASPLASMSGPRALVSGHLRHEGGTLCQLPAGFSTPTYDVRGNRICQTRVLWGSSYFGFVTHSCVEGRANGRQGYGLEEHTPHWLGDALRVSPPPTPVGGETCCMPRASLPPSLTAPQDHLSDRLENITVRHSGYKTRPGSQILTAVPS